MAKCLSANISSLMHINVIQQQQSFAVLKSFQIDKGKRNLFQTEEVFPELEKIQKNYIILRHKFGELFSSTAGMVDTLDWLYTDYIAKVCTASNNLILGTPTCQFRYSGQNNLTLYSYFGIIKSILEAIYKNQKVST